MVMDSMSNVNKSKQPAYDLNAKHDDDEFDSDCSICLEPMVNKNNDRTIIKLQCDHMFHLDCIGSAFNAKNKMQCPNCRNIEQGRWLYATGLPLTNFSVEDRVAEFRHRFSTDLVFGMEVCPFGVSDHLNPFVQPNMMGSNIFSHEPRPDGSELCPYIEYNAIRPNPYSLHADQLNHLLNPSHLVPISLLPTNPRIFWNVSHPEVIRTRHYFAHPLIDPSLIGYGTPTVNVPLPQFPQFPSYLSGSLVAGIPVAIPYLGSNSVTSALVDNAPMAWPYLGDNLQTNALLTNPAIARPYPVVPPLMEDLSTSIWHSLMFPSGWGQLPRGVIDFWSIPYGLNHMMYGGGGINNIVSGSSSNGRENSSGGESNTDISGGSGGREGGRNGGDENRDNRGT